MDNKPIPEIQEPNQNSGVQDAQSQPSQSAPTSNKKSNILIPLVILLSVGVVALFIYLRVFVLEPYKENGPSMSPTINNGQFVLVKKSHNQPKRGDIIVIQQSGLSKYGQPDTLQLIKRVVGLPGDRIQIMFGKLTVFNLANPNGFDPDKSDGLSNQVTDRTIDTIVPSGTVFLLGDNRRLSLDSREFGPVPLSNIIGKVISKY